MPHVVLVLAHLRNRTRRVAALVFSGLWGLLLCLIPTLLCVFLRVVHVRACVCGLCGVP